MIRLLCLNDTIMIKISQKQQKIISIILEKGVVQSSEVYAEMVKIGEDVSHVTVKRMLSEMVDSGVLALSGGGRSTSYGVMTIGRLFADIDAAAYCAIEPDRRFGLSQYNFNLLSGISADLFSDDELIALDEATVEYKRRTSGISATIQKKELERLIIELSWKSSKIEGNTYTLLDTEKLILEHKEAPGHKASEARMILNHKDAFTFVHDNKERFVTLSRSNLEELHSIVVKDLSVGLGLRKNSVGITGSKYRPLDNVHQIIDAVAVLSAAVSQATTAYAKALIALLGISYIQPFEDGNKRTARLMANALLLAHGCTPLSYRSVDENDYREAMLVFYELNSITPFKEIFVGQYEFAARNYAVK